MGREAGGQRKRMPGDGGSQKAEVSQTEEADQAGTGRCLQRREGRDDGARIVVIQGVAAADDPERVHGQSQPEALGTGGVAHARALPRPAAALEHLEALPQVQVRTPYQEAVQVEGARSVRMCHGSL